MADYRKLATKHIRIRTYGMTSCQFIKRMQVQAVSTRSANPIKGFAISKLNKSFLASQCD